VTVWLQLNVSDETVPMSGSESSVCCACQFYVQNKEVIITVLRQHAGSSWHSCSCSHSLLLSLSQTSQLIDAGLGIIILLIKSVIRYDDWI